MQPIRTRRRTVGAIAAAVLAPALALVAVASPPVEALDPPEVTGRSCAPGEGVTVVVDFQDLGEVALGCAPGEQASGFAALTAAGFTFNESGGAPSGALCQIGGLPTEGYPYCWYQGYWSYWRSDGTAPYGFATTGPSAGPLAVDAVEGWSWDGPGNGSSGAPRVAVEDLADHRFGPADCSATPQLPTFDIVDDDEVLPVALADGHPVEVAVIEPDADPATATFAVTEQLSLADESGPTRVLARRAGDECPGAATFDATYDVRAAYAPRWNQETDGAPSPAVDKASDRFVGWASGHSDYSPGANVNDSFKTPANAYGPVDSSLVVLGDAGSITLTFDVPIADGPGHDLAAFENGFASGAADYLELAWVEVSSDGETFVRFDSASRRTTPVASFGTQLAAELGGVAGKDLSGKGTPFDLALLANRDEVRGGAVDLGRITHVRLVDIVGDGSALDSFGRPIYDPNPLTGSAGFDLMGVGVLNQRDVVAPVVEITAAPSGTVAEADAMIEFTVDDPAATVEHRVDEGAWSPATSPLSVSGLANGAHTVEVRATDPTGNVGSDSASWAVDVPTPLTADESWATAAMSDLLGTRPTPEERAPLVADLVGGATRTAVARDLVRSDEWIHAIVADLYDRTLGRAPDPAGLAYWTGQLSFGRRSVAQVAASFYASAEYHRRAGGTDQAWVTDLYEEILGRAPDPAGLAHWVARTSERGRTHVAGSIYGSAESRRDRVRALYAHLLGRSPDPSGLAHWSERIATRGDLELAVALVASAEYGRRAVARFPSE